MKKNHMIEIWRFVASLMIAGYHAAFIFKSGWIFVEFFFMLTGYFTFKHMQDHPSFMEDADHPVRYTIKKLLKIMQFSVPAILSMYIGQIIISKLTLEESLKYGLYLIPNMLLINGSGMVPKEFTVREGYIIKYMPIPSHWYLTVLIIAVPLMMYLVKLLYKRIGIALTGLVPMMIYGYLIMKDGSINGWHEGSGFYIALCLRALAGLLLGAFVYYLGKALQERKPGRAASVFLLLAEFAAMALVVYITTQKVSAYESLAVILLIVSLTITLSGVTVTSRIRGRFFLFLGKLGLPIYCIHPVIAFFFGQDDMVRYYVITLVISAVMVIISDGIRLLRAGKKTTVKGEAAT